jgi:hypothetical protein
MTLPPLDLPAHLVPPPIIPVPWPAEEMELASVAAGGGEATPPGRALENNGPAPRTEDLAATALQRRVILNPEDEEDEHEDNLLAEKIQIAHQMLDRVDERLWPDLSELYKTYQNILSYINAHNLDTHAGLMSRVEPGIILIADMIENEQDNQNNQNNQNNH